MLGVLWPNCSLEKGQQQLIVTVLALTAGEMAFVCVVVGFNRLPIGFSALV
tara:strand:+ start:7458 stop:7610 length:153 start_codon:yes stop_codon:yes gene_type:complete